MLAKLPTPIAQQNAITAMVPVEKTIIVVKILEAAVTTSTDRKLNTDNIANMCVRRTRIAVRSSFRNTVSVFRIIHSNNYLLRVGSKSLFRIY